MAFNLKNCSSVVASKKRYKKCLNRPVPHFGKRYLFDGEHWSKSKNYFQNLINDVVKWYDEFTGMDDVRKAQHQVLEEENNFKNAQTARRQILTELNEIHRKIKEVYAELDSTSRSDDKYLHLVTLEHKLLKEEKTVTEKFSQAEAIERDTFTALSNSVKFSHERERAQRERTKYWSVIGSVFGTVLGVVASSINNHFRMNELKQLLINDSGRVGKNDLKTLLVTNTDFLNAIKLTKNKVENNFNINKKVAKVVDDIDSRLVNVEKRLNALSYKSKGDIDSLEPLTETINNQFQYTNMILMAVAVLTIFTSFFGRT